MTYEAHVIVGPHEWTFVEDPDGGDAADDITVLSGLRFGWEMKGTLWPAQPDAMVAAFAVNLPNFVDGDFANDVEAPDRCVIEVKADSAGPVVASFYGDVTDYQAKSREGRPGVTVSVVAVDDTARLRGNRKYGPIGPFIGASDAFLIGTLWGDDDAGLSSAGGGSMTWPVPVRTIADASIPTDTFLPIEVVLQLLDQAVDVDEGQRLVLAPMIDPDGLLMGDGSYTSPSDRKFTLDLVDTDISASTLIWEPPAGAVRRDNLDWGNSKANRVYTVIATGWGGDSTSEAPAGGPAIPGAPGETGALTVYMPVTLNEFSDAVDVASFYWKKSQFQAWQLNRVDVEVTRAQAAGVDVDVPVGLFPDWTLGEDNPARASCYGAIVNIPGVDPTRTPDGLTHILGRLVGATCTIARGALTMTVALRRPANVAPDNHDLIIPGLGLGAIGTLVPA